MLIQQKEENHKGVFFVEEDGKQLAEMTYSLTDPDIMIIDHTEVDEVLKGKNIGAQLVHAGAEYARTKHFKIIPLCPFAKKVFEKKHEEYKDILKS